MHERPGDIFQLYKQKTPSIQLCLADLLVKSQARGMPEIEARVQTGLDYCLKVQSLEYDWNKNRNSSHLSRPEASETNMQMDQNLKLFHAIITSYANSIKDSKQRKAARRLQKALFPTGIQALTGLKLEAKSIALQELNQRLGSTFQEDVKTIGATNFAEDILELGDLFTQQLSMPNDRISYDDVEKARVLAEDAYHVVLTLVLAATVDSMDDRKAFLSAVIDQQERQAIENKAAKSKSETKDAANTTSNNATPTNQDKSNDDESTRNTVANIIDGAEKAASQATDAENNNNSTVTNPQQSTESSTPNTTTPADDSSCAE